MSEGKFTAELGGFNVKENETTTKPKIVSPRSLIPTLGARKPLTPIQKSVRPVDNDMVKVKKTGDASGNFQCGSKAGLAQIRKVKGTKQKSKTELKAHRLDEKSTSSHENPQNVDKCSNEKAKTHAAKQKIFSSQSVQTENPEIDLVTGDVVPPGYYEQLAETRRGALEETINENKEIWEENERLKEKVDKLERENSILMELAGPEKIAEFYDTVNQLDNTLNENSEAEDEMWVTANYDSVDNTGE